MLQMCLSSSFLHIFFSLGLHRETAKTRTSGSQNRNMRFVLDLSNLVINTGFQG
jgi:hypothetical protein